MSALIETPPNQDPASLAIDYRFPFEVYLEAPYTSGPSGYVGYLSLFDRYAEDEIGIYHGTQPPRFVDDFGYDAEHNHQRMIWDFSFNVHPRDHMQSVYAATLEMFYRQVMDPDGFIRLTRWLDPADIPIVRFVTPLHDVGEGSSPIIRQAVGAVVGDIPHGKKTAENKRVEAAVRGYVFSNKYPDIPDNIMARVEAITSHSEDSPAHQTYVWGHEYETYQTAEIAGRLALKVLDENGPIDLRFNQLVKLATEVGTRTRLVLAEAEPRFIRIREVLRRADIFFTDFDKRIQAGV